MILEKFSHPTKFDQAPHLSIWLADIGDNIIVRYIQTSEVVSSPVWERLGLFFEKSLIEYISNHKFMEICYRMFKRVERNEVKDIIMMIKNEFGE